MWVSRCDPPHSAGCYRSDLLWSNTGSRPKRQHPDVTPPAAAHRSDTPTTRQRHTAGLFRGLIPILSPGFNPVLQVGLFHLSVCPCVNCWCSPSVCLFVSRLKFIDSAAWERPDTELMWDLWFQTWGTTDWLKTKQEQIWLHPGSLD